MTAPSLHTIMCAMVADLATLAGLRSCALHRGRFTLAELSSRSLATPALRVALMGVQKVAPVADGTFDLSLKLSACLITTDTAKAPREAVATEIINILLLHLPCTVWGLPDWVMTAQDITASNLFSGQVEQKGVQIWETTWVQTCRLGLPTQEMTESQIKQLYAGFAPHIGADHKDDYTLVAEGDDVRL